MEPIKYHEGVLFKLELWKGVLMAQPTFEERLEALEKAVAQLADRSQSVRDNEGWRGTIGMFTNDPVVQAIQEEGRKIREAERRDAQS